jgi:hypothetical protein
MTPRPRKVWWPRPAYEARPWIALALGAAAALASMYTAFYQHDQSALTAAGLGAGSMLALYGGVIMQARNDFRASERRRRAALAARVNRDLPAPVLAREPAPPRRATTAPPGAARRGPGSEAPATRRGPPAIDPLLLRVIGCVLIGCLVAGASLYSVLDEGSFTMLSALGLLVGSLLALYGALLQEMRARVADDADAD